MSYGLTIEGGGSQSRGKSGSITQLNANLRAGGTLYIVTGRDATIAGANIAARDILLDVGRNLTIASRQDTAWSENSSSNVQASVTFGKNIVSGSLSIGGSSGSSEKAWVTNQTSLIADRTLSIRTDNHTQIDGALLLSRQGDLTLDTATLGFSTLKDIDKGTQIGGQIGLGIAYGPDIVDNKPVGKPYFRAPTGTLQGEFSTYDRRQDTNATVGPGTITIRTPTAQAQDIATLNRDPTKAQVITKDTSAGTKVYVSSEAIKEIASGGEKIKQNLEALADQAAKGFPRVRSDLTKAVATVDALLASGSLGKDAGDRIKLAIVNIEAIDPRSIAACGQGGFNLFDLFISRAHAAADGCLLRFVGRDTLRMSEQEFDVFRRSVLADSERQIQQDLPRYRELSARADLSEAEQRELASTAARLQQNMRYFELCGDRAGTLRGSGLIAASDPLLSAMLTNAESYRSGAETLAAQILPYRTKLAALDQIDRQLGDLARVLLTNDPTGRVDGARESIFLMAGLADGNGTPGSRAMVLDRAAILMTTSLVRNTSRDGAMDAIMLSAVERAVSLLPPDEQLGFLVALQNRYALAAQNLTTGMASLARQTALVVGGSLVATLAAPAAAACVANPVCLNSAGLFIADLLVAESLGGASLVGVAALATRSIITAKVLEDAAEIFATAPRGLVGRALDDYVIARLQAGRAFDVAQGVRYDVNQIYVLRADGTCCFKLDSYQRSGEIVSRKLTQLGEIQEGTAMSYLSEFVKKYSPNTIIADVPTTRAAGLAGERLLGQMFLEVPVQNAAIPKAVLDRASELKIKIRDIAGKTYN